MELNFFCRFAVDGLVVQLDRIPDFGSGGWGFESSLGHYFLYKLYFFTLITIISCHLCRPVCRPLLLYFLSVNVNYYVNRLCFLDVFNRQFLIIVYGFVSIYFVSRKLILTLIGSISWTSSTIFFFPIA